MEEARKRLSQIKSQDSELLGEDGRDDNLSGGMSPLLRLAEIEEDQENEEHAYYAEKLIRKGSDANTIELVSPYTKGVLRIRNPKIAIASDPLRFQELMHIEQQIVNMQTMPDFGYEGDNFIIERP